MGVRLCTLTDTCKEIIISPQRNVTATKLLFTDSKIVIGYTKRALLACMVCSVHQNRLRVQKKTDQIKRTHPKS